MNATVVYVSTAIIGVVLSMGAVKMQEKIDMVINS